jgi:hypothetical protein
VLVMSSALMVSSARMVAASLVMAGVLKIMTLHCIQMFQKCLRLLIVEFNNCMPCHTLSFFHLVLTYCFLALFHVLP